MAVPLYKNPTSIPNERTLLPAVSVVTCGGFLHESAAVVRFGNRKKGAWVTFLLLNHQQRSAFTRQTCTCTVTELSMFLRPDFTRRAVLLCGRHTVSNPYWYNAENLWVAARWMLQLPLVPENITHKIAGVIALAERALQLTKEDR